MAIALVSNTKVTPAGNSGGTSPGINTTGANLIILAVTWAITHSFTVSDSKGNTYTGLNIASTAGQNSQLFYCLNPTVGAGHTFTISGAGSLQSMCIEAFSGVKISGAFDQQNTNTNTSAGTTIQTGSVTASAAGCLLVTVHGTNFTDAGGGISIDNSFVLTDYVPLSPGTYYGTGMAYLVQGAASAINPTWTDSVSNSTKAACIASFLPAPDVVSNGGRKFPTTAANRNFPITNRRNFPVAA